MTDPNRPMAQDVPRFDDLTPKDGLMKLAEHIDSLAPQDVPGALSAELRALPGRLDALEPGSVGADELGSMVESRDALNRALDLCGYEDVQLARGGDYVWPPEAAGVHGTPFEDEALWHLQGDNAHGESGTCAVVAQEMIIYKFTGEDPGENTCLEVALDNGWFNEGGGTTWEDVGKIVDYYGIDIHKSTDNTLDDLADELDQGHGVIVGVEAEVLWFDSPPMGFANHAICVTGYERTEDGKIAGVWVNDSGSPDGQGHFYDAATFQDAFEYSGGAMVATDDRAPGLSSASTGS
jgi:hypothetical protein